MAAEPLKGQKPWELSVLYTEHNNLQTEVILARDGQPTLKGKIDLMATKDYVQSQLVICGGPTCGSWEEIGDPNQGVRINPTGDGVIGYDISKNRGPLFYF